jgi:hypothetical protein
MKLDVTPLQICSGHYAYRGNAMSIMKVRGNDNRNRYTQNTIYAEDVLRCKIIYVITLWKAKSFSLCG